MELVKLYKIYTNIHIMKIATFKLVLFHFLMDWKIIKLHSETNFLYMTIMILVICCPFTKSNGTTSTLCITCPVQVSSFNTILEICKTIFMVDNIKMNERNVYLLISTLLLGQLTPMI